MRVPLEWMREHCSPDLDTAAIAERLDLTGTEVARVERHGVDRLEHFVVGRVVDAEPHPDADRLSLCRVDVGGGEVAQIVCGAPNVAAGQTVAVARPGAVMPDGTELGVARLRGVESHGMILAEDELGIGTDHGGILVLQDGPAPGTALTELIPLGGDVLELAVTPNRPDCLSVYGIAREVHAATGAPLAAPPWTEDLGSSGPVTGVGVEVEDPDLCPRFTARAFEGVTVGPSPPWLRARLMAAGQRPINNVVDLTNYVMLLTGQPLHAFDLDRVAGGRLVVRRARQGERVRTLDGAERAMDPDMVVICDDEGPTSIAAVMGGERSEVGAGTNRVLLEVATWDGPNVQRTSTRLGLRSEASTRFEKQLQPEQALEAQAVATRLFGEVCGARPAQGTIDVGGPGPEPPVIELRHRRVREVLGVDVPAEESEQALRALEFTVDTDGEAGLRVTVPARRRDDVQREIDVIEEIARLCALERLPLTLPASPTAGALSAEQLLRRRAEDALVGRGLREIAGWSFAPPDLPDRLRLDTGDERRAAVALANPMSEEESTLRTTVLGSLLDVARRNVGRGAEHVRLFESGAVYLRRGEDELPEERHALGLVLIGAARPPSWNDPEPGPADVHAVRALLEALGAALRVEVEVDPGSEPFLAPGRAGTVSHGGLQVGWLGELHPAVAEDWDVPGAAALEVDLGALCRSGAARGPERFRAYSEFPPVLEDIAVLVPEQVPARTVVETVERAGGELLASARLFDVYRGEQVGEGSRSLALRLEFRAADRTLTDEEVAEHRERITEALGGIGGTLRA